jgi:hypothetical protein
VLPQLFDGGEGSAVQGLSLQDREPDFHLVEPGGSRRREVEMDVWVALEPAIPTRPELWPTCRVL